ncbi:hypothetical protein N7468_001007 [Penicillium chermesinum]|uniref:Uncharacterized protein n=1 Tax=Penicillium chermesinum TaxID=63820 RepID=A0A9W9TY79_9EURO|nr:uncharacterized protein N7468_001007 [Penicillium chermesinum]KAJ5246024.1 hypothetical protein N7468_001007 [Penicillium chermesinum]
MGHNVSVINGVRSENFYEQRNGIHEIWVGDTEVISRLPFGDSDLGQSSWFGKWPKIPWHQFIIPLKRDITSNITMNPNITMDKDITTFCRDVIGMNPSEIPNTRYWHMFDGVSENSAQIIGFFLQLGILCLISWRITRWRGQSFRCRFERQFQAEEHNNISHGLPMPCRIQSWRQAKPWLVRHFLSELMHVIVFVLLSVFAMPLEARAWREYPAADLISLYGWRIFIWILCGELGCLGGKLLAVRGYIRKGRK